MSTKPLTLLGFAIAVTACISDSGADSLGSSGAGVTPGVAGDLLTDGAFELAGCGSWTAGESVPADETGRVRDGTRACRVCSDSDPLRSVYGIRQRVDTSKLVDGATYVAQAWVAAPPTGTVSKEIYFDVRVDRGEQTEVVINTDQSRAPDLTDKFQTVQHLLKYDAKKMGTSLVVEIVNRFTDHGCFIVDSLSLVKK